MGIGLVAELVAINEQRLKERGLFNSLGQMFTNLILEDKRRGNNNGETKSGNHKRLAPPPPQ